MKICTRLSVAVLFPVLCIIMFFIEHLAQVCIAKRNVQLRFRFFVFDSFYSCFNSQCTLETTSLEISVYCPYPIYITISSMFRFELLLKGLMDFFDAHTKFLIIKRMNFKYPFWIFGIKSERAHNDIDNIHRISIFMIFEKS